jgi:hypothetical protein
MTHELSLADLEGELSAELPTRNLLRRRKRQSFGWFPHASSHASASFGSAANSNATYQVNFNPQIVINNGKVDGGGIDINSHNTNDNDNTQTAVPINFGIL